MPELKKAVQDSIHMVLHEMHPGEGSDERSERGVGHCCNYVCLDPEDGRITSNQAAGDVCHARLRAKNLAVLFTFDTHQGKNPRLIEWIANESPFAHAVLNGKSEDIIKRGVVIDGRLCGYGGMLWLAKALRYWQEDTFRPPWWQKFFDGGVPPLMAMIGCSILDKQGKAHKGTTHNSLYGYGSPAYLKALFDKQTKWGVDKFCQEGWDASDGGEFNSQTWGDLRGKKEQVPDGWGGYTMVDRPGNPEDYISALINIAKEGKVK